MSTDTDPSAFLCGDIQFYSNINDIYLLYLTLPCLFTLRIVRRVRALYFIPTRISKTSTSTYIYNNHGNTYKTTAITNIPTTEKWSSYPRTSKSQLRRRKSEMLYVFSFSFSKNKDIMILILLNPSHTLSNYLPCPPSSSSLFSSLIPSHPSHPINPSILTHPVPRFSQFLLLGNPQKSRSTFWN